MDKKYQDIIIDCKAKVVWMYPPETYQEEVNREQANILVRKICHDLQYEFEKMILQRLAVES